MSRNHKSEIYINSDLLTRGTVVDSYYNLDLPIMNVKKFLVTDILCPQLYKSQIEADGQISALLHANFTDSHGYQLFQRTNANTGSKSDIVARVPFAAYDTNLTNIFYQTTSDFYVREDPQNIIQCIRLWWTDEFGNTLDASLFDSAWYCRLIFYHDNPQL